MRKLKHLTFACLLLLGVGSLCAQLPDDTCAVRYRISPSPASQYDPYGSCILPDGRIFTLAAYRDPSPSSSDMFLKSWITSSEGATLAEHEYIRPDWRFSGNILNNVISTSHHRIIATAIWGESSGGHSSELLLTFDGEGYLIRSKEIGADSGVRFTSIRELPNGNLLFAGYHQSASSPAVPVLMVTDSLGKLVWQNSYSFPVSTIFHDAEFIQGHGILVAGGMHYDFASRVILNVDTLGNLIWTRTLDIGGFWGDRFIHGIRPADSSGVILFGEGGTSDGFTTMAWIGKFDWSGVPLWNTYLGGFPDSSGMYATAISDAEVNEDGSIVGVGACNLASNIRGVTVKVSPDGTTQWVRQYSPFPYFRNEITDLETRPGGAGYLTLGFGATSLTGNRHDLWYLWLDPQGKLDTCSHVGTLPPAQEGAFTLYPNPANGEATLLLPHLAAPGMVEVTTVNGAVLLRMAVLPGQASLPLDLHGLPAGIHLVTLNLHDGRRYVAKLAITR